MPPFCSALLGSSLVFAALAAPHSLIAQTDTSRVTISGTVIDPSRNPIAGAEVRVVGSTSSVLSSDAGTFRLLAAPAKDILIQIRRPGYSAQLLKLTGAWTGTILLEPGKFQLPEIQVNARWAKPARYSGTTKYDDYFRRQRQGFGIFIGREEIESRNPFQTTEIFQGRAGIHTGVQPVGVTGGSFVMFARCSGVPPKINVYVDGRKQ
ncbi:MAG TPA: carboxypeptidase-like regulatory domain-containing protein, partial [Gemmatimonadales bacterium]|nr:carboxypeptidase-like regulatory domain-containing protein [Gemmatimonadales bacterium]